MFNALYLLSVSVAHEYCLPRASMKPSQGQAFTVSPHDQIKMEERKRSLVIDHDDVTQPNKRQATTINGAPIRMDAEKEKDIEVCYICRKDISTSD